MLDKAQRRMTPEEFYAWQEGKDERYELVDGYPVPRRPDIEMMTGASRRHDQIVVNILRELGNQLRGTPCRVFSADTAVKTRTGRRRPDAGVECGPLDEDAYVAGEVRLVAEVLSPSTRDFDTFGKVDEYKEIPTLDHIIIIEPNAPQAILWSRGPDQGWARSEIKGMEAAIEISSLHIRLPLEALYSGLSFRPKPPVRE